MTHRVKPILAALLIALPVGSFAEDYLVQLFNDKPQWRSGGGISLATEQQRYEDHNSLIHSATLSGYLAYEDWRITAQLPYLVVSAEQLFINNQPRLNNSCAQFEQLAPPQRERLRRARPRLVDVLADCEPALETASYDESGVGDISVFGSYGRTFGSYKKPYVQASLGFSADNAAADQGLGSGTQDVFVELMAQWRFSDWGLNALAGFNWVAGGDFAEKFDNYYYSEAAVSYDVSDAWQFSAAYFWQSALAEIYSDIESISATLDWRFTADQSLRLSVSRFDEEAYPNETLELRWQKWF